MYPVVDVLPGALVLCKLTDGIQGDFRKPQNEELMDMAEKSGYGLPMGYAPSLCARTLLNNDFQKFLKTYPWAPDETAWEMAQGVCYIMFARYMNGVVQSIMWAISQVEMSGSPGYPFNLAFATKLLAWADEHTRQAIIDCIMHIIKTGKYLLRWRGKIYLHPTWKSSPKEENRPIDKLVHPDKDKRKTRVFMAGEFVTHIICIMLYGDQNNNLLNANQVTWSKYGMSMFYGGWDNLARYILTSDGNIGMFDCNDFRHFEASLKEFVQCAIYKLRNRSLFCTEFNLEELCRMQCFVIDSVVYSYVIDPNGWLMLMFGGNPSGGFNTLTDNVIASILCHVYLVVLNNPGKTVGEYVNMCEKHHLAIMGDDSVIPVHKDFARISQQLAPLGFTVSPERPSGPLEKCVFLNCGFAKNAKDFWFAVPNFDKIRSNIYFCFEQRSWRLAYVKACAYRTLCYMDKEHFKEANAIIEYILKKHGTEMRDSENKQMEKRLSYHSAISQLLPLSQLQFMWTGLESTGVVPKKHRTEFMFGV